MNSKKFFTISLAILLAAALPAFAGGPLNLNPNDPDNFERWPGGGANIPFNIDQGALGPLTNAQATTDVLNAFQTWQNIPTATATYQDNGQLPFDVTVANFAPFIQNLFFGSNTADGLSPVVFDADGSIFFALFGASGVLGFASPDTRAPDGTPIEAVCFLNGGLILSGFPVADFRGVMVHEFGHYSGMAHTVVNGQAIRSGDQSGPTPFNTYGNPVVTDEETMYPFAIVGADQVTLHMDDTAFFSTLYPAAGFFSSTGTVTGRIFAPNGTTRLTGVNVIARNVANPFVDAVSAISGDRGVTGEYRFNGLTPGASYTVHVDRIQAGGFSTPPLGSLPGPEEFYNGAAESNNLASPDPPGDSVAVSASAGGTASGINIIFNTPAPGDPLPVGDDGSVELFLPFPYFLCGQRYNSVFVNANGNVSFGAANSDFTETAAEMLSGPPRIAGLWDDLNPNTGGIVTYAQSSSEFTVIWDGVPEFLATGSNSFRITLKRSSDHIDVQYGSLTANDGIAGVSCGGAMTSRFETPTDLSAFAPSRLNLHQQPAVFEVFGSGNPNDSANSVLRLTGTTNYRDVWSEPNNSVVQARLVSLPFDTIPVTRFTEIFPAGGDVDFFRFTAQENTTLVAEIVAGTLDSLMGLYQLQGTGNGTTGTLIAVDDDSGPGLLSRLMVPITTSGDYALAISAFPDFDFSGDGNSGSRYVLNVFSINGTVLPLGDDTFFELNLGFDFPYQGNSYSSVFVNSNGNLTFGSGDTDFSETVAEFLNDQPRIAGLWDDLSPNLSGLVIAEFGAGSVTISFVNVPQFLAGDSNSFSMTLFSSGEVEIAYGLVAALDGIVGVTQGGGAANPGETNFSSVAGPFSATGTTFEQFTGAADPFDLDNFILQFLP